MFLKVPEGFQRIFFSSCADTLLLPITYWPFFEIFFAPVNFYSWPLADSFFCWNPTILKSYEGSLKKIAELDPEVAFLRFLCWNNAQICNKEFQPIRSLLLKSHDTDWSKKFIADLAYMSNFKTILTLVIFRFGHYLKKYSQKTHFWVPFRNFFSMILHKSLK